VAPRKPSSARGGIRVDVVRHIVRIIGEAREIGTGEAARQHLLAGVMHDLGAAVGGVVLDGNYRIGFKNTIEAATLRGFDSASMQAFVIHDTEGSDVNPYHAEMMSTMTENNAGQVLSTVVAKSEWEGSTFVNEYTRPVGLDHFAGSIRTLGKFRGEGIGLMRERTDRPFSQHDRDVLEVYMHEAPRFFASTPSSLPPRLRRVLEALSTGASEKQIAAQLGLSPHTVHQYVKGLFRRYRVHSRMELVEAIHAGRLADQ
jgi:DNA-binding CsgD family transcriptional regulator